MHPPLRADARLRDDLVRLRHDLHRDPEVGLNLPRTQDRVLTAINGLGLEIATGTVLSSVTAVQRGAMPGPTVLLRADMDALPVTEQSNQPVVSLTEGVMHACGHDLHTAMLVGAARLLNGCTLPGNVIFMFQPGEEGYGGAKLMVDEGVLEAAGQRPEAAYALHVSASMIPRGVFVSKPGPILGACDTVRVTVRGCGGHSALPHLSKDPVPAACEMVTGLQTIVTRRFDAFDPVVATVTSFHAGSAENVISGEAYFTVSVRSFSRRARTQLQQEILRLIEGVAAGHGLDVEADYSLDYPVTVNDPTEVAFVSDVVAEVFGKRRYFTSPRPFPASEDFSFVLDEVPGAFVAVGACPANRDPATAAPNHSGEAVFDDAVLLDGARLYAELAVRRLNRLNRLNQRPVEETAAPA